MNILFSFVSYLLFSVFLLFIALFPGGGEAAYSQKLIYQIWYIWLLFCWILFYFLRSWHSDTVHLLQIVFQKKEEDTFVLHLSSFLKFLGHAGRHADFWLSGSQLDGAKLQSWACQTSFFLGMFQKACYFFKKKWQVQLLVKTCTVQYLNFRTVFQSSYFFNKYLL